MKPNTPTLDPLDVAEQLTLSPEATALLDYLQQDLDGYPFDPQPDRRFVDELLNDFPHLDLLEEIKIFRWYHDDQPFKDQSHPRAALRRWIARGRRYGRR